MAMIPGPTGGPDHIKIDLRRSARARRISLRVSGVDGKVSLTLPPKVPEREALRFASQKLDWIVAAMGRIPQATPIAYGQTILLEGQDHLIVQGPLRGGIERREGQLIVPGRDQTCATRLAAYFKMLARDRLSAASDHYAAQLGRRYTSLTLRDTRSRWGSCTAAGGLMYSWRLIMAPPKVLDYVAAHEVAHLAEMNHSDRFWAVVAALMPDYAERRHWLKQQGGRLHAYRFEA